MTSPPNDDAQLRQAFALFSETSEKLAEAYLELQAQVGRLTSELAAANGELARRERLSALGEMSAQMAHQLRTPLATALLYVSQLARPQLQEDDRLRFADKTLGRLRHLERLIQDMLLFVKGGQGSSASTLAIADLLEEVRQSVEPQLADKGVRLDISGLQGSAFLAGDHQALLGALINLLENALQACAPGGRISLTVTGQSSPYAAFRVEDDGAGIPESARERLFEPFFTTRGEGSGLGLAIVRQVADAHGGWVEWSPRAEGGSCFQLYLPFAPAEQGHG